MDKVRSFIIVAGAALVQAFDLGFSQLSSQSV